MLFWPYELAYLHCTVCTVYIYSLYCTHCSTVYTVYSVQCTVLYQCCGAGASTSSDNIISWSRSRFFFFIATVFYRYSPFGEFLWSTYFYIIQLFWGPFEFLHKQIRTWSGAHRSGAHRRGKSRSWSQNKLISSSCTSWGKCSLKLLILIYIYI